MDQAPVMGHSGPCLALWEAQKSVFIFDASSTWEMELMIMLSFPFSSPAGICNAVFWKTHTLNSIVCGSIITPNATF